MAIRRPAQHHHNNKIDEKQGRYDYGFHMFMVLDFYKKDVGRSWVRRCFLYVYERAFFRVEISGA